MAYYRHRGNPPRAWVTNGDGCGFPCCPEPDGRRRLLRKSEVCLRLKLAGNWAITGKAGVHPFRLTPSVAWLALHLSACAAVAALPIDNTCTTCSRRLLDSLNVHQVRAVRVNQVGYRPQDSRKFAFVANPSTEQFTVVDVADGSTAYQGTLAFVAEQPRGGMWVRGVFNSITDIYGFSSDSGGTERLYRADFSPLSTTGRYFVVCGGDTSATFHIHPELYNTILETALRFFGANRCGDTKSWLHGACHLHDGSALGARFDGALTGGWHDCGDHGKYSETEAYAALVLSLTYALWPQKAEDFYGASYNDTLPFGTDGIPDILWEVKVGADHIHRLFRVSRANGLIAQGDMYHSVGTGPGADHNYWDKPERQDAQPASRGGPPRPVTAGIGSNVAGMYAASGDERFGFDLWRNTALGALSNAQFNDGVFAAGLLAYRNPFHHGGWTTDYEQVHAFVLYGFAELILRDNATAASFGLTDMERDSLLEDITVCLANSIRVGSNGSNSTDYPGINVDEPYHGVFTSADWGYNRYNLGLVNELFMYWDLTGEQRYFDIGIDNLNYNMGLNPWDISFIMGTGDRNLQHPHNRAANPDGYNAGGVPYEYRTPVGALMGGSRPTDRLVDDWEDYTVTETCIDFSAQLILPAQMLAKDLPPDTTGPRVFAVTVEMVTQSTAVISWRTDELSADVLRYGVQPGAAPIGEEHSAGLATVKSVTIDGLTPGTTYHFVIEATDVRRNVTLADNNGTWYHFTTATESDLPSISDVRACNVSHERATIYWWTPDAIATSLVNYGTTAVLDQTVDHDDSGLPGRFHAVTLTGLIPNTTYYYEVVSNGTTNDDYGQPFTFTTRDEFVDYDVYIKPTNKGAGTAHFYITVTNNETQPCYGVELRFYYQMPPADAAAITPHGFDMQLFDVGGTPRALNVSFGTPVRMGAAYDQYWYLPITIDDTLPVAGRARFEIQFNRNGWDPVPFSELEQAWSIAPHTDPVTFDGVDLAMGGVYVGPEFVEVIDGAPTVTYVNTSYITAHHRGTHVYGYPPDW
ncbi:MAG: glycoside hydrolase, partial [Chitinivibrionales bacterium]|nr:glycoside hydrolase [Chitinivibrionales bacterium]